MFVQHSFIKISYLWKLFTNLRTMFSWLKNNCRYGTFLVILLQPYTHTRYDDLQEQHHHRLCRSFFCSVSSHLCEWVKRIEDKLSLEFALFFLQFRNSCQHSKDDSVFKVKCVSTVRISVRKPASIQNHVSLAFAFALSRDANVLPVWFDLVSVHRAFHRLLAVCTSIGFITKFGQNEKFMSKRI